MSFDFEIKGDPAKALEAAKATVDGLKKVEASADSAGKAIAGGLAGAPLRDAQGRFLATGAAAAEMKKHVENLTDEWDREDKVLQRIKGPLADYNADLKALVSLQDQGVISAREYSEQLDAMRRKAGIKPPPSQEKGVKLEGSLTESLAGQLGETGSLFESLASKGALEASALAAIGVEAIKLGDDYLELSNKARRLAGSDEEVAKTIEDQLAQSKALHGGLEQTMELSTAVKERTENLNLTQRQQTAFTRELAESVQLSGHAMGDTIGLVQGLGFALEEGIPAGKQLKQVMREFPEVAKVMEEQTGKTAKQLIEMGNKGQFSMSTLVDAFHAADTELSERFGKRTETLGQQWQHFKDDLVVTIGKFVESTGIITKLGDAIHLLSDVISTVMKPITMVRDAFGALEDKLGTAGTVIKDLALGPLTLIGKPFGILGDLLGSAGDKFDMFTPRTHDASEAMKIMMDAANGVTPPIKTMGQAFEDMQTKFEAIARQAAEAGHQIRDTVGDAVGDLFTGVTKLNDGLATLGITMDKWGTVTKGGAGLAMEHAAATGKAKQELSALNAEMKLGGIGAEEYRQKSRALQDQIEGGRSAFRTVLYGIEDPIRTYNESIGATRALYDADRISLMQYENEIEKLQHTDPGFLALEQQLKRDVAEYDRAAASARIYREEREHGIVSPASVGLTGVNFAEANRDAELELAAAKRLDAEATKDIATEEKKGLEIVNLRVELMKRLATPAEKVREDIDQINKAFAEGSGGAVADYDRLMTDLKLKFFDIAPEEKYRKALHDIDETAKLLHATEEEVARAHAKLKQEFGQPLSFSEGIDAGLKEIAKEIMDVGGLAKKTLVDAFHSGEDALIELVTTGKTDFSSMIDQMEKDLARLALRQLEMSFLSSLGIGGIGGAVAGALPQHAMGDSWVVPGSGAGDNTLVAWMGEPGERVTVTPRGGSSSSSQQMTTAGGDVHFHLHDDPRALVRNIGSPAGSREVHRTVARDPRVMQRFLR